MRKRMAFTLVELLVVIGIIALLLAILLPALNRARQQANSLWCLSNLRQIGIAITAYTEDNNGNYPLYYWNGDTSPGNSGATDWGWLILPYMKGGSNGTYAGQDAGALWALYDDKDTVTGTYVPAGLTAPFPNYDPAKIQTYSVLTWPMHYAPGEVDSNLQYNTIVPALPGPQDDGEVTYKAGMVKRPSDIIMVMDAAQIGNQGISGTPGLTGTWEADADLWDIQSSFQSNLLAHPQKLLAWYMQSGNYPNGPDAGFNKDWQSYSQMTGARTSTPFFSLGNDLRFRHMSNSQANALFYDGHCDSFHYKHPGSGGTDLQFKNFILDDYRWQDIKWGGTPPPGVE